MIKRRIGISGQLRNGKDSLCDMLLPCLNGLGLGVWTKIAFADAIKDLICRIFGITREFLEEWKIKDEPPPGWDKTIREALIGIGDLSRDIKPTVWWDKVDKLSGNLLVSDCRYLYEANKVIRPHGVVIRIIRPGYQNDMNVSSETELSKWDGFLREGIVEAPDIPFDYVVYNDGTLDDLRAKVESDVIDFCSSRLKFYT